jgi:hypothetical protein
MIIEVLTRETHQQKCISKGSWFEEFVKNNRKSVINKNGNKTSSEIDRGTVSKVINDGTNQKKKESEDF